MSGRDFYPLLPPPFGILPLPSHYTQVHFLPFRVRCLNRSTSGVVALACKLIPQMFAWEMYFTVEGVYLGRVSLNISALSGMESEFSVKTACLFGEQAWAPYLWYFWSCPCLHCNPENSFSKITNSCFTSRVTKSHTHALSLFLKCHSAP